MPQATLTLRTGTCIPVLHLALKSSRGHCVVDEESALKPQGGRGLKLGLLQHKESCELEIFLHAALFLGHQQSKVVSHGMSCHALPGAAQAAQLLPCYPDCTNTKPTIHQLLLPLCYPTTTRIIGNSRVKYQIDCVFEGLHKRPTKARTFKALS